MIIKQISLHNDFSTKEEIILTIGAFDGIHLGHKRLFDELQKEKKNNCNYKSAVLTFLKHPDLILKKREDGIILDRTKAKFVDFESLGIDYLFLMDSDILSLSYEMFHEKVLNKLNVKLIIVGDEFRYGKGALGNVETLKKAYNVRTYLVLNENGLKISSTEIRELLKKGNLKKTKELLGYNYSFKSSIIEIKDSIIKLQKDNRILLPCRTYSVLCKTNSRSFSSNLIISNNSMTIHYDDLNFDFDTEKEVEIEFI